MENKSFTINGHIYKRISKNMARKQFNAGSRILLIRNKTNPNYFVPLYHMIDKGMGSKDFDKSVNAYEYYNSEPELGNRTEFYINTERAVLV